MELNEMEIYVESFRMKLNELITNKTTAGIRNAGLNAYAGSTKYSNEKVRRETERNAKAEAKNSGGENSQEQVGGLSVQNFAMKVEYDRLAKLKKNNAALLKHNTNPTATANKTGSAPPTVAVASQNKQTPPQQNNQTPNSTPVKSPLPAGHNPNKPKKIKTVGPLKTYQQMFPKNK